MAVLVGDFLFAQSSWFLAKLDNLEVGTDFLQGYFNAMEAATVQHGIPMQMTSMQDECFEVIRLAGWLKHCNLSGPIPGRRNAHLNVA